MSMCIFVCVDMCLCVFVCMHANVFLLASLIIICQLCVTSNVHRGNVYKYFTSASTFFHSICDIMNLTNYNALLPMLDLLRSLQFTSHYNSHDLLHLIYC